MPKPRRLPSIVISEKERKQLVQLLPEDSPLRATLVELPRIARCFDALVRRIDKLPNRRASKLMGDIHGLECELHHLYPHAKGDLWDLRASADFMK